MTSESDFERIETTSLSRKTREVILDLIMSEQFEGGRLPTEDVLAEKLGVSRTTVRAALQSLQRDGFITRRRGVGTLVNRHVDPGRLGLCRLIGFSTLLREVGHEPSVEIEVEDQAKLLPAWRERLRIGEDVRCFVLHKLFRADGNPAIKITDVIPFQSLRKELDAGDVADSIFDLFAEYGRQPIDHAVVELAPRNAMTAVARTLALRPGAAYLELLETHYAVGDADPVALSIIEANDKYVRFDVIRRLA